MLGSLPAGTAELVASSVWAGTVWCVSLLPFASSTRLLDERRRRSVQYPPLSRHRRLPFLPLRSTPLFHPPSQHCTRSLGSRRLLASHRTPKHRRYRLRRPDPLQCASRDQPLFASLEDSRCSGAQMGWWGLTFPIGTHAVAAATLGRQLGSTAFKVVGTVESVAVVLLWIYVRPPLSSRSCTELSLVLTGTRSRAPQIAGMTTVKSIEGSIFSAPCLGPTGQVRMHEFFSGWRRKTDDLADAFAASEGSASEEATLDATGQSRGGAEEPRISPVDCRRPHASSKRRSGRVGERESTEANPSQPERERVNIRVQPRLGNRVAGCLRPARFAPPFCLAEPSQLPSWDRLCPSLFPVVACARFLPPHLSLPTFDELRFPWPLSPRRRRERPWRSSAWARRSPWTEAGRLQDGRSLQAG
jgi:hypothetical protein